MNPESGTLAPEEIYETNAAEETEPVKELPENVTAITPYERVRKLDLAYEDPKTMDSLSTQELEEAIMTYTGMPEYHAYHELYLNFHTMDDAVDKFREEVAGTGDEKLADDLQDTVKDIRFTVSNYYKAVMIFERTDSNKFRMEPFEFQENMERVDKHRTAMHNRLIDSVIKYTRLCNKIIPEKTGYHFPKTVMFDPHLVLDLRSTEENLHRPARNKIATWAFLNERGVHIEKAIEHAIKLLENKKDGSGVIQ